MVDTLLHYKDSACSQVPYLVA